MLKNQNMLIEGEFAVFEGHLYRATSYWHEVEIFEITDEKKTKPVKRVAKMELEDFYCLHTNAFLNGMVYIVRNIEEDVVTYERAVCDKELFKKKLTEFEAVFSCKNRTGKEMERNAVYIAPGVDADEIMRRRFVPEEMHNGHIMLAYSDEELGVVETINRLVQLYGERLTRKGAVPEMLMCDYYIETIIIDNQSFCVDCDFGIVTISPDGEDGDKYIREIAADFELMNFREE